MAGLTPQLRASVWAAGSDAPEKTDLKIGFIPLTDCASVVMANAKGFDKKYGLTITPTKEASWAAVRDKLVNGEIDASHVLYGLIYGVQNGIGGPKKDMAVLMNLNHNGQAFTLSRKLYDKGVTDGASLIPDFETGLQRTQRHAHAAQENRSNCAAAADEGAWDEIAADIRWARTERLVAVIDELSRFAVAPVVDVHAATDVGLHGMVADRQEPDRCRERDDSELQVGKDLGARCGVDVVDIDGRDGLLVVAHAEAAIEMVTQCEHPFAAERPVVELADVDRVCPVQRRQELRVGQQHVVVVARIKGSGGKPTKKKIKGLLRGRAGRGDQSADDRRSAQRQQVSTHRGLLVRGPL